MQPPGAMEKLDAHSRAMSVPFSINQNTNSLHQLITRDTPTLIHIKPSPAKPVKAERKQGNNDPLAELEMIGRKLSNFSVAKEGEIELAGAPTEVFNQYFNTSFLMMKSISKWL
jgi:hypothetical protein